MSSLPRVIPVIESVLAPIELTDEQAASLNRLGATLASNKTWWGENDPELDDSSPSSIIRCTPVGNGTWNVIVMNAVGIVAADGIELTVEPKIPVLHALDLFSRSQQFPRLIDIP